jgi:CBS domain-containing protein
VDDRKRLVGVLSRGNVMAITSSVSAIRVKGIMSTAKFVATLDMDISRAVQEMIRLDEWYVPVVKSSQDYTYAGMLSLESFIDAYLKRNVAVLSKPISEIMSTKLVTVSPDDEVDGVWRLMQERSFAGIPVVKKDKLVGIVTQKDLLDSGVALPAFEAEKGRFKAPPKISSVMKTSVISLKPIDTIRKAAELMLEKNIGRVLVVDENKRLVGVVDREDIAKALL